MIKVFIQIIIYLINCYQYFISPMLGNNCMFKPTCSEYTKQAFSNYGLIKGSYLAIKRILRCHPWQTNYDDPLPKGKYHK